jgi:hypothetical protein
MTILERMFREAMVVESLSRRFQASDAGPRAA